MPRPNNSNRHALHTPGCSSATNQITRTSLAAERRIKGLEQKLGRECERMRRRPPATCHKPASTVEILRRIDSAISSQFEEVDRELANKRASEQQLHALMAGYQASVNAAPKRESELTELIRDYRRSEHLQEPVGEA